jgi:hypothetical protein
MPLPMRMRSALRVPSASLMKPPCGVGLVVGAAVFVFLNLLDVD